MADSRDRGTSRCIICGGWLGFHPLRTRGGSICGRVDENHAKYLLDRKMEKSFCRIARRRKNTILLVFILIAIFIWVLWLIVFTAHFATVFVGIVSIATLFGAGFLYMEFRTAMLGDRMERICRKVDLGRPVSYETGPGTGAAGARALSDPMRAYLESEPARQEPAKLLMYEGMAPTSAETGARMPAPEGGMPGAPQRVMAPGEWESMSVEGEPVPAAPPSLPAEGVLPAEAVPGWVPPPPPPTARATIPPPPPIAVPPTPIEELPAEAGPRRPAQPPPPKAKVSSVSAAIRAQSVSVPRPQAQAAPARPAQPAPPPSWPQSPPQPAYQPPAFQQPAYQQPQQAPRPQPAQPQQPAYQQSPYQQPAYQQPQQPYPQSPYQQPAYQQPQPAYAPLPQAQRPAYAPAPQPAQTTPPTVYAPQYFQQQPAQPTPPQQRPKKPEEEPVVSWEEY